MKEKNYQTNIKQIVKKLLKWIFGGFWLSWFRFLVLAIFHKKNFNTLFYQMEIKLHPVIMNLKKLQSDNPEKPPNHTEQTNKNTQLCYLPNNYTNISFYAEELANGKQKAKINSNSTVNSDPMKLSFFFLLLWN